MKKEVSKHYSKTREQFPDYFDAIENLGRITKVAGPLNQKTAELIQLAASVSLRSEGATHSHTKRAIECGATADEIRHAVIILSNTIGFPAVMAGLSWVNDVLNN